MCGFDLCKLFRSTIGLVEVVVLNEEHVDARIVTWGGEQIGREEVLGVLGTQVGGGVLGTQVRGGELVDQEGGGDQ